MGERDDLVNVRLTKAGAEHARGGPVQICGGNYEFRLEPGKSLQVTRGELTEILSRYPTPDGKMMFEIHESAPALPGKEK